MDFIECLQYIFFVRWYIYNPPFLLWFPHPAAPSALLVHGVPDPPVEQNQVISVSYITATCHWVTAKSALFSVKRVWKKSMLAPVTLLGLIKNDPMHKEWNSYFPVFMALLDYMILELVPIPVNYEAKELLMGAAWATFKCNEMQTWRIDHINFICVEKRGFNNLPFYKR